MNNNVRETFTNTIERIGSIDERLVVIVSDISHYRLQGFATNSNGRYLNLGVCENSIVNVAAGMAHRGYIPVLHTFASFLVDRSFEQIKLSFGYHGLPVNLVSIGSGIEYSYHGVTHHSYIDGALIKSIDGSMVFNPGSTREFDQLFSSAYNNGCINLFRATTQPHNVDLDRYHITPGRAVTVTQGSDLAIFCTGQTLSTALASIPYFKDKGVEVEVVYLHTLKPLDTVKIKEVFSRCKKSIVMEHQFRTGGLFSDIASLAVQDSSHPVPNISPIDLGDKFVHEYGTFSQHNARLGFSIINLLSTFESMK
jgi:transketolase